MGHERRNAQQEQHQSLNGQRGAQHTTHETVAAGQHGGVDVLGTADGEELTSCN